MHTSKKYGLTYKEILKDGFKINYKIKLPLISNKSKDVTKATGVALIGLAKTLDKLKPNLIVVFFLVIDLSIQLVNNKNFHIVFPDF